MKNKAKFKRSQQKLTQVILIIMAVLLISGISFRSGESYQKKERSKAVVVKLSPINEKITKDKKIQVLAEALERKGIKFPYNEEEKNGLSGKRDNREIKVGGGKENKKCVFVASKKSDKYHRVDCHFATKIKKENKICFASKKDAESMSYHPAKCIKSDGQISENKLIVEE